MCFLKNKQLNLSKFCKENKGYGQADKFRYDDINTMEEVFLLNYLNNFLFLIKINLHIF